MNSIIWHVPGLHRLISTFRGKHLMRAQHKDFLGRDYFWVRPETARDYRGERFEPR